MPASILIADRWGGWMCGRAAAGAGTAALR